VSQSLHYISASGKFAAKHSDSTQSRI